MTPELRSELGWYVGVISFSAWGSAVGLGMAGGFFPHATKAVLAHAHLDLAATITACVLVGYAAAFLSTTFAGRR